MGMTFKTKRKIGGQVYTYSDGPYGKRVIQQFADKWRARGHKVRLVKIGDGWAVFTRTGD